MERIRIIVYELGSIVADLMTDIRATLSRRRF